MSNQNTEQSVTIEDQLVEDLSSAVADLIMVATTPDTTGCIDQDIVKGEASRVRELMTELENRGQLVVNTTPEGECVSVTRISNDQKTLEVLWSKQLHNLM